MSHFTSRIHTRRSLAGQTIYQVMLIISCVAFAVAVFFPVYEYITLYSGDQPAPTVRPATKPAVTPEEEAPAPTEAEEGEAEEGEAPAAEGDAEMPPADTE